MSSENVNFSTSLRSPTVGVKVKLKFTGLLPDKLGGSSSKMWQKKMFFCLITLKLSQYRRKEKPILPANNTNPHALASVHTWEHGDFLFEELTNLLHEVHAEGMRICVSYQVACMIEKLHPGWNDFKNYLKLKRKRMSLEALIVRLRIESTNRKQMAVGVQIVDPNEGHKSFECRKKKASNKNEDKVTEEDMCAVVTEANVAESHPKTWWFDTGATRHICLDRLMFSSYVKNKSDEELFMGNSATSMIEGYGKVVLKLTYGRELILTDVVYVPDMRKNLVSGSLLSKHRFAFKIDVDKLVISKTYASDKKKKQTKTF
ncbi:hypothetical protein AXX17_AT3G34920 [Arabidopsis thaliana]|uniref:Retrovirus-related Pol polyprotein from transposon TNT 1-94-like beta-barrel domain-containing protein n=1 Tax=Arabidopsis thaliana TaxID=3702 RepID=A0A178VNJ4_ARATH|nr:hypothetical protein AXX17_AT3G34920 [Arabidopsis thaliana]